MQQELNTRFVVAYGLSDYDAGVLTEDKNIAGYFEAVCSHTRNFKAACNWVMGPVKAYLNEMDLTPQAFAVAPETLAALIALIDEGKINFSTAAQRIFPELIQHPDRSPLEIAQQSGLLQDSTPESIQPVIDAVIKEFPLKVEEYKSGKKGIMGMFMGEIMKRSKGKADPRITTALLIQKLQEI